MRFRALEEFCVFVCVYLIAALALLAAVPFDAFNLTAEDSRPRLEIKHSNLNYCLLGLVAGIVITFAIGVMI